MAPAPGTRLGAYEVVSLLGEGGMGQVYRAKDIRLKRDVALKILPDAFATDPDRVARFQREAELLATLNHPNIAGIYGLEQADGVRALVLELVEGPTLADRIAKGPLPIDEALVIAGQIADALEAAHERGVIHRDLKPANIKLTPDDQVKVLDFGLAKMLETAPSAQALSMSPTLSVHATYAGMILGTAAYMSPEQARGKTVDKRTDVWAFGCVLFEMLTGTPPFQGEDVVEVIGALVHKEPEWTTLPVATPPLVRLALQRCLEKDPKARVRDIGDVRLLLAGVFDLPRSATGSASPAAAGSRSAIRVAAGAVIAALLVAAIAAAITWGAMRPAPFRVVRTTITPSGDQTLTINGTDRDIAITPDGSKIVYVGNSGRQLFVRPLDALEPVAISSISGSALRAPFVSPDGQWVGFFEGTTLKKIAISGGPALTITPLGGGSRGATWAPDDTIIFAASETGGLLRVPSAGGKPERLTEPDRAHGARGHLWPEMLPGGRAVLFTIGPLVGGPDAGDVAVLDLPTGRQRVLVHGGSHAHYVSSGHLVYVAAGTLRAIPFDAPHLETRGTAVPVLWRLAVTATGTGDLGVAQDGTLTYVDVPGSTSPNARILTWVDRTGKEEVLTTPHRAYLHPRISPDGMRVVVSSGDEEQDLWLFDIMHRTFTRLTLDPSQDWHPVWTPDGRRVLFTSNRDAPPAIWWQAADGTGAAERVTKGAGAQFVTGITPDGTTAIFNEQTPTMGRDLLQVTLDDAHRVTPLLRTPFSERNGEISPNGRWMAYESDSSGRYEIYVRPYPNVGGGQWQVSTAGGTQPRWARNGKEMFFFAGDGVLQHVVVDTNGGTWSAGTPTKLVDGRYFVGAGTSGRTYDVAPDGQRFLVIKAPGGDAGTAPSIAVVQHFDEELKRLAPAK